MKDGDMAAGGKEKAAGYQKDGKKGRDQFNFLKMKRKGRKATRGGRK